MLAKTLLPAFAAVGVQLAAAQGNDPCSATTFTINSQADASAFLACPSLKGDVVIGTQTDTTIKLDGPQSITGQLKVANNGNLQTLSSSTIQSIGGTFELTNVTLLTTLSFTALNSVGAIRWQHLSHLTTLTLGSTGITSANNILITDTFLDSLTGINVANVQTMNINNNGRLTSLTSSLQTVSDNLLFQANGANLAVSFPRLIWCRNMTIQGVGSFDIPALRVVNGSMRFNENQFSTFFAPNLTNTAQGDVSFVSNGALTNITMPVLKLVSGGFTIANNTKLAKITGFPALETVGGAVKIRGSFDEVSLPALKDVKGAFDVTSTTDISSSCAQFQKLAPKRSGGGGQIQGSYKCESNNENANANPNGDSTSGSGGGRNNDDDNAGASVSASLPLAFGLVAVAGLVQALL